MRKKLKRYDPCYTWNRGGRLKEIRIRHFARKFYYLWKIKTWGSRQLTPSVVQLKLDKILKQKYFTAWRNLWWERNKEWKLEVRAKIHYESKTFGAVFENWRQFVERQKRFRELSNVAESFYHKTVIERYITKWIISGDKKNTFKGTSNQKHF